MSNQLNQTTQSSQSIKYYIPNGVHTVLVTPFIENIENTEIDYKGIEKWVNFQANSSVVGLVLFGSTSEAGMLSKQEKLQILDKIVALNSLLENPKFITIGISGSNDIREVIEFARDCVDKCDAFMITVPHYVKPTQEGIVNWFEKICNDPMLSHKSVIMYNIPSRACTNMLPLTMKTICDKCFNVIAVKEASGSLQQMIEIINLIPNIKLFSGDDGLTVDVIKNGGVGVISVASNVIPNLMTNITKLCFDSSFSGDYSEVEHLIDDSSLNTFLSKLFCESNPIPIKFALYYLGIFDSYQMRTPLTKLSEKYHTEIIDSLVIAKSYDVI